LVKLMSIFPAGFGALAMVIFLVFYPLNETKIAAIAADLKARREAAGEPVAV